MMKTFAAALTASTLLAAPALAEDTMQKSTTPPPATQSMQSSGAAQTQQQTGQWRGSKLIGLNVYNANNEKVGDINELIMNKDGQIDLVVVGAGGFLGMGEHNVALKWNQVKFVDEPVKSASSTTSKTTGSGVTASTSTAKANPDYPDHAMISMTKDQLKALPAFTYASSTKNR